MRLSYDFGYAGVKLLPVFVLSFGCFFAVPTVLFNGSKHMSIKIDIKTS
jgi:hypothetical protein